MARDWANEPWRKLYIRDEPEWLMLPWQARGLFYELLKRVDKAGVMTLGKAGRRAIAAALSTAWDDDLSSALTELENDGSIVFLDSETQLFVPNFAKAQCASTSNAERQRRKREKRSISLNELSAEKHSCHEKKRHVVTRDDTRRHVETRKEEKRIEEKRREEMRGGVGESLTLPGSFEPAPPKSKSPKRATHIPDGWEPSKAHIELAAKEGRDVHREAAAFRDHAAANGRVLKDWEAGFRTWLRSPYGRGKAPKVQSSHDGESWLESWQKKQGETTDE